MAHWCFWLSPSPQLFFVLFCFVLFVFLFVEVVLVYFISLFACYAASSETQGQIVGARESLNGRKNIYGTKKS